jgi:hypothetical protein
MASDHRTPRGPKAGAPDSTFSYGVREMRQANAAKQLQVDAEALKAANEKQGFDPYNTSGGFDRKNNWVRVGKR